MGNKKEKERREGKRRERGQTDAPRRGDGCQYVDLPKGFSFQKLKEGRFRFDFLPYVVGAGNPRCDKGKEFYERTFYIHRGVGPKGEWVICPAETENKPCPVCEWMRANQDTEDKDKKKMVKALKVGTRQIFIVKNLDDDEKGYHILEASHWNFGRPIEKKVKNGDDDDNWKEFWYPGTGQVVKLLLEQSDAGKWNEVADVEFKSRGKRTYSEDIAEEMPCLDEMLIILPYEDLKTLMDEQPTVVPEKGKKGKAKGSKGKEEGKAKGGKGKKEGKDRDAEDIHTETVKDKKKGKKGKGEDWGKDLPDRKKGKKKGKGKPKDDIPF